MAYGVKYRFDFYSKISNTLNRIDILEDAYVGDITILTEMGSSPITIKWDGGEFEKNSSIVASEAVLQFVQTSTFDIDSFFSNTDQKYKVNHYLNSVLNWTGFTQTDDLQQPYQDPPNIFTVRAVDGLSYLKTIDLVDENGDGIWGLEKIMYFCQRCLAKTGHELNIINWINIFPYEYYGTGSLFSREFNANVDPFNLSEIFGQSFMVGKNRWDNCYNVLSKILFAFDARCFQWEGEWHFVRTEDYIYYNDLLSSSTWSFDGEFPDSLTWQKDFSVQIGTEIEPANRSVIEGRKRAVKSTQLTHIYSQWPQIIRNDRFLEGAISIPLSVPGTEVYVLEHWTLTTITSGVVSAGADAYARFELPNLVITEQYMYIVKPSGSTTYKVMSTSVPLNDGDQLTFSFRMRQTDNTTGAGTAPSAYCYIRVDSSVVYWLGKDGKWTAGTYNKTTEATSGAKLLGFTYSSSDDPTEWRPYSLQSDYFPVPGDLYIEFWSDGIRGSAGDEVNIGDIEISITPFVYSRVNASGQLDKLEQTPNIINRYEEVIDLANTPTPTNQGSLFATISNVLTPLDNWFHAGVDEEVPFMRIVNKGMYRSLYRGYNTLQGQFVRLMWDDAGTERPIGLINTFYLTDDKRFISSSLEIDYWTELNSLTLIELFTKDGTDDTAEPDTAIFRYLDEKDFFQEEPVQKKKTLWQKLEGVLGKGIVSRVISLFKK